MSPLREGSEEPGTRLGQLGFTSARRGAFILDSAWRALQIPDARPRLTAGHSGSHKCEFHGAQYIDAAIFCLRVFIGCDLVSGEQRARKAAFYGGSAGHARLSIPSLPDAPPIGTDPGRITIGQETV